MKYYKNADKLTVEPRLKEHLSKFKTIEDFRVLEPQINEMLEGVRNLQSPDKRRHRSISESEGVTNPISPINRSDVTLGRNDNYNRKRFESVYTNHQMKCVANKFPSDIFIVLFFFFFFFHYYRCDSFGNRPVTATSSQNRRTGPGGRVRSGSTGNRPQTAINRQNHIQQQTQPQQNTQSNLQQVIDCMFQYRFQSKCNSKQNETGI